MNYKITTWALLLIILVAGVVNYIDHRKNPPYKDSPVDISNTAIAGALEWAKDEYLKMMNKNKFDNLDDMAVLYGMSANLQNDLSALVGDENYPWLDVRGGSAMAQYLGKVEEDGKVDKHEEEVLRKLYPLFKEMPIAQVMLLDPETDEIIPERLARIIQLNQQAVDMLYPELFPNIRNAE